MNTTELFRAALAKAGLDYAGEIIADGKLHRFKADGDHQRNSWYVFHAGPPAAGAFGCWKRGFKENWCERIGKMSQAESDELHRRWKVSDLERKKAEMERHARARKTATWIWEHSQPVSTHGYLSAKGIKPHGELRQRGDLLVLPLRDPAGELHSLQFIAPDKRFDNERNKQFLGGGRIAGCFFTLADTPDRPLLVVEGYATGASVHEATGFAVVCAMNCGNLLAVSEALREKFPEREIIIAADNDQFTEDNPGLTKATKAATMVLAKLAVPEFQDFATKPTDFNDVHQLAGLVEVARQIQCAAQPVAVSNETDLHAMPEDGPNSGIVLPEEDESDDPEPKPFPIELLPPALAKIVVAVASSERVPFALSAVCALGVTSAAIGAGLEVASAADRSTRANLFFLADAESGSGKSQVFRRIAEPILEHQRQLHEAYQEKTAHEITSEIGLLTREIKQLEAKAAKESTNSEDRDRLLGELQFKNARLTELKQMSMSPSVVCGDVTSEKLAVLLAANHETMFSASSEARQILAIVCGRYNSTNSPDEAIYLASYSGDFLKVDRLGRDSLTLHKPCLAVLWLVQPDAMARLYSIETLSQSGFLPRFLPCRTLATPVKIVAGEEVAVSYAVRAQWAGLIAGLLATYHVAEKPYRIEPTPEAKRLLDDFFNEVVDRRLEDLSDVGQFASRYGEQAWRVSLTFHAALYGIDAYNHPLDAETAQNAIGVVRWFINAQLDILTRSRRQAAARVEEKVLKLLDENRQRQGRNFITAREVHRARITTTADAAKALLARMDADGLLHGEDIAPAHGGKTTRIYSAIRNPVPE